MYIPVNSENRIDVQKICNRREASHSDDFDYSGIRTHDQLEQKARDNPVWTTSGC
jgi:hypothetical protein